LQLWLSHLPELEDCSLDCHWFSCFFTDSLQHEAWSVYHS
jgi:hypothetical protein